MSARYLGVLLKGVVISLLAPLVLVSVAQAAIQCYECHGGASDYRPLDSGTFGTAGRNDATGAFTGNHQTHMGPITTQSAAVAVCASCHNPTVSTSGHRDGNIGMSTNINSSAAAATYSKGPSFAQTAVVTPGTCSNANCHFETTTPLWGTTTLSSTGPTTTTCNVCHSSQLSGTPTKAHTTHLNYIGTSLNNCASCHPNYNALGANAFWHATSAGQRRIKVSFVAAPNNGIGTYSGAGDSTAYPNYLPSQSPLRSGTCSATHCHSDGHIQNGTALGSQNATPNAPAMVASWGSTWANSHCANCHGDGVANAWPTYANSGPATTMSNSHQKHMLASGIGCQNCHVATATTGTSVIPGGQHIDKLVQVAFNTTAGTLGSYAFNTKTCSATTCHGNNSPAWGGATTCASCHESMGAWGTSTDTYNPAHQKHVLASGYDFSCQNCHSSATTGHATGPVTSFQSAEVKYNTVGTTVVTGLYGNSPVNYRTLPAMTTNPYNAAASATPWYTGSTTAWTTDSINPSVKYSAGTCGNVYCHSNAAPVGGANSYVNATWSTTPMTCNSCHNIAASGSARHTIHATTYGFTCKNCHDTAVSSNTTISSASIHVNAVKDVAFNWNSLTTGTYNNTSDTCSNIYCHSPGTANAAPFAAANRVATWTTILACDGCHPALGTGMTTLASGSHTRHIIDQSPVFGAAFTCDKCHANTVTGSTTISNAANHVNQLINVNFQTTLSVSGLATYTGSATPGAADGSCNSVYCHSDGHIQNGTALGSQNGTPGIAAAMVTWGQAWAGDRCVKCHGDGTTNSWPTYANSGPATTMSNSHSKHMLASGIGCVNCHVATAASNTTVVSGGGQHIDKLVQVAFNTTAGALGSYAFNTKTCSTTTCHGTSSPAWGGATTCASCHESMGAWGTSTDTYNPAHQKHVLASGYDFSCQNCHSTATTAHATGPVTTFQSAEVKYNTAGTAIITTVYGNSPVNYRTLPSMTTNPYNGAVSAIPWYTGSTTAWTTDTQNATIRYSSGTCGNIYCHSNAAPVGGINTYVNTAWSTTPMTCNSCHNIGTSGSARHTIHATTYGFTCKNCHDTAVSSNTTISSASIHVNAVKDVAFNWNSLTTGTYNNTTDTCSNIYCHSSGTANAAPFTGLRVATWTTIFGCDGCHAGFGAGITTIVSGAHLKHVALTGVTCNSCHNATASNNTTISSIGNHVNYNVTINFNSGAASASGTYNGTLAGGASLYQKTPGTTAGTCSTTLCHGGNSGNWGTASTDATCVKCHGIAGSTQALYTSNNNLAAPGYLNTGVNTAGIVGTVNGGVSVDAKVGAHNAHLRAINTIATQLDCVDCHALPTSPTDANHMNGVTNFVWSSVATKNGTLAPFYSTGNNSCSNVYCHGNYMPYTTTNSGGTAKTPTWTTGGYLSQGATPTLAGDCSKCHMSPPVTGSHFSTMAINTCNGCHSHVNTAGVFTDPSLHINGKLDGGGCNGCHSFDVEADGSWGTKVQAVEGFGAHGKHIVHIKALLGINTITATGFGTGLAREVCGTCHSNNSGTNHSTSGGARQINFGDAAYVTGGGGIGSFSFVNGGSMPTYTGVSGTSSGVNPKNCSNVSCHFGKTPVWSVY